MAMQEVSAQWEDALTSGAPLLAAAEQILRNSWLLDLPIVAELSDEDVDLPTAFAEVKVVALHWNSGPTTSADQIMVALPSHAIAAQEGQEIEVPLFHVGVTDASEVGEVRLLLLPATYLVRRLVEGCPQQAEVLTFSLEASGALPACSELYGLFEFTTATSVGAWVYLYPGEGGRDGDPDASSCLKVTYKTVHGEGLDELYVSASEQLPIADPRQFIVVQDPRQSVGSVFRERASAGAKRAAVAEAASPGSGGFTRGGVARERAVAAVTKATPPAQTPKATAPKKPKTLAELATSMTSAMESFSQRLGALEASQLPQAQGGRVPLQGPPAPVYPPDCAAASLLSPGRVPARNAGPPLPIMPAGERAYRQAIADARTMMPSVVPEGMRDGEVQGRQGRERTADSSLRLAVEQGGETAAAAVQLAMLETLERLASGGDKRGQARGETMEELLFGSGTEEHGSGSNDSGAKFGGGVRGVLGMQRIAQSIDAEPERWSALFDQAVYRALGADLTGAPWSCHRYGIEKINFGRHGELKKMWYLLSTLHALHRGGKIALLGAKIAQFLKATEVATTMNGSWS
eukprot:6461913-Amphidinium_carterae.1